MRAFERVLASHEPFPAVVLDRRWNVVRANDAARRLTDLTVDPTDCDRTRCALRRIPAVSRCGS
jgi:hypothetical protein